MKYIYLLTTLVFVAAFANAQYCGNSGPSVCSISGHLQQPAISPHYDSLPLTCDNILQFRYWDSIVINGQYRPVGWLRFDSITNLPKNMCWGTSYSNNIIPAGFHDEKISCIKLESSGCGTPGQYRLLFWITVNAGGDTISLGPNENNLVYFTKVVSPCDTGFHLIDTNQTIENPFTPYNFNGCLTCYCTTHIADPINDKKFSVSPNPSNSFFTVSVSEQITDVTFQLYNALGELVKHQPLTSTSTALQREALPNGIYFWQVSSNEKILSQGKLILE